IDVELVLLAVELDLDLPLPGPVVVVDLDGADLAPAGGLESDVPGVLGRDGQSLGGQVRITRKGLDGIRRPLVATVGGAVGTFSLIRRTVLVGGALLPRGAALVGGVLLVLLDTGLADGDLLARSEERRVGKRCR